MPYIGQDIYKNAAREGLSRAANTMRSVRSGEYLRVPPERSAPLRGRELSTRVSETVKRGNYFPNNIRDKQSEMNKRSIAAFMERKAQIDQGR